VWCDRFDADLLALVPGAADTLGDAAGLVLSTYSHTSGGAINHPSCWHTDFGLVAFFWTRQAFRPPASYVTDAPVVSCTLLEAIRDEWLHGCTIVVDRKIIWKPPVRLMEALMAGARGWRTLAGDERAVLQADARRSLHLAAELLAGRG
jgi:hypothetical protein